MSLFRLFDVQIGERDVQLPTPPTGATMPAGLPANQPAVFALVNTVSSDPGVNQDSTQGYSVGSVVFNNTAGMLRFWSCRDNTAGNADWVFEGADYANGGTNPAIEITQFGGAPTAQMAEEGNINRQVVQPASNPNGTNADRVLATYTLPTGAFDASGRGIAITACGYFVSNTNTKTVKIIVAPTSASVGSIVAGGTTVASLTTNTTGGAGGWQVAAQIFKYGAANSSTQLALHEVAQGGNVVGPLTAPSPLTNTEGASTLIAITGNAVTAATDIGFSFLQINAMN